MPSTPVELCNLALSRIGSKQPIDSLDEDTTEARACTVAYPFARDAVLASFPWRFATKRVALAALTGVTYTDWQHAFALPADCLEVRGLVDALVPTPPPVGFVRWTPVDALSLTTLQLARTPYAIEAGTAGQVLLTNDSAPVVQYTARVEAVSLYPPLFCDALAWRLAGELALAIPMKAPLAQAAFTASERAIARAAASELRQAQAGTTPDSETIRVR